MDMGFSITCNARPKISTDNPAFMQSVFIDDIRNIFKKRKSPFITYNYISVLFSVS